MLNHRPFSRLSRLIGVSGTALLAVGVLAAVSAVPVGFAQTAAPPAAPQADQPPPPPPPHLRPKFSDLDTNKDGVIDKAEFAAIFAKPFADMDTNHDGVISEAEFDAFRPDQGPDHGPHHGPHHGPDNGPDKGPDAAHDHAPPRGPALADLDTNKDGKISLDEFLAGAKAHFDRLDTNHDGVLEASELPKPPVDGPPPPAK